jgi:acetylornithine deacetylase
MLTHLQALVACDTQNPPRKIDGDSDLFTYCSGILPPGFATRIWDHGDGHVSWFAVRGRPQVLFNVHLDTVPAGEGWSSDPLRLRVTHGRGYGLGACDIKGAAAVLLALAEQGAAHLALLFTSDEEGEGGCCVDRFLAAGEAARCLELAAAAKRSPEDPGTCFNLGLVQGGTKSNVIAGEAFVHWSARLRPGESSKAFLQAVLDCVEPGSGVGWEVPFQAEPLPMAGNDDAAARGFCGAHGLAVGEPVDFWTEAALFSAAGLPALVLGPGAIGQAHTGDEWVAVEQLERAYELYGRVVNSDG